MSSLRRARTRLAQRSGAIAVSLAITSTSLVVLTGTDASARPVAMTPSVVGPAACSSVGLTITPLHGPNFYIDSGITPQLMGAYAGYNVTNTGSARTDLWVKLANFSGGRVDLGSGQAAGAQIPSLAGSASQSLFWFLTATGTGDGAAQNHDIQVWSGRPDLPGSTQLCGSTGGFSAVKETIKAAANKLTSVTVDGGTPKIGNTFTITVQGETGTVGSGPTGDNLSFWMTPAASASWPAGAYRLVSTTLSLQGNTYTDQLRVAGLASSNGAYTATYTFRAIGYTASSASVVPIQQISSGTQIKHTDLGTIASLPAITPATNDLALAKTAGVSSLPAGGGDVAYEVAVSGSSGAVLDDFVDTIPAGATLKAGTATWRGTPIPNGQVSSGALTFSGPFTLGASNNKLAYTLTLPATAGDRTNSVTANVGSAKIDSSLSLTSDIPAAVGVHVDALPTPVADAVTVTQNVPGDLTVLGNDTDPEHDALTILSTTQPSHGTTSTNGSKVTYTPAPGYIGTDSFTYTVSDGHGGTATATVTVTVAAPAELMALDDTDAATAGSPRVIDVLGNDSGNAPISVTAVGTPSHGTVQITGGGTNVTYTADPSFVGSDTFTYDVQDATEQTGTATVHVTVSAPVVPDPVDPVTPPALVAEDDTASTDDATPVTVHVLYNDHGFGALGIAALTQPTKGSVVDNHDGTVTYTPASGQTGDITFTYDVTDAAETPRTDTGSVTVSVSAAVVPEPVVVDPVADSATTSYDASVLVDVLANDPSGATIDTVGSPGHGTTGIEGGKIRYTPAGDFAGPDTFTYTIAGSEIEATVTVEVSAPELAAADDSATAPHGGTPVTVHVLPNDTGVGLTVTEVSDTAHGGTAQVVAGGVEVTPADGYRGEDSLTYTVTDVVGHTDTATIRVTVPNAAPTVDDPAARTIVAGTSTTFPLTVGDDDPDDSPSVDTGTPTGSTGAATQVTSTVLSVGGSPTVTVNSALAFSGTVSVPVTVSDGHGGTATTTLHVTVTPKAPIGVLATVLGNPSAYKAITAPAFDAKGKPVARTLSTQIDSRITWRGSPTTSVTGYVVKVNGTAVCHIADTSAATQSCTVADRALRTSDVVAVTALGQAGTISLSATVPVAKPTSVRHLLAVVYFPVGDFRLDATARAVLARVDAQAVKYGFRTVRLEGHTDSDGSTASNQTLSRNRSRQVGQWLVDNDGRVRIDTDGFGESRPAMPNTSSRYKAANRRVEIYVGD